MVKHHEKDFREVISDQRLISTLFLGVGLVVFFLNISSFLSFLPREYSFVAFDVSTFSSMLIIVYSVYMLHVTKK